MPWNARSLGSPSSLLRGRSVLHRRRPGPASLTPSAPGQPGALLSPVTAFALVERGRGAFDPRASLVSPLREERAMQPIVQYPRKEPEKSTEPTTQRLRTITGNKFPRKCACGCGLGIPRDPEIRYVVDFGTTKPYPAYLRSTRPTTGATGPVTHGRTRSMPRRFLVSAPRASTSASLGPPVKSRMRTRRPPRAPRPAARGPPASSSSTPASSNPREAGSRTTRGTGRQPRSSASG